jgi:hypothetical protein
MALNTAMLVGPNAVRPDKLTAEERLTEIGEILAAGVLRARNREAGLPPGRMQPVSVSAEPEAACSGEARPNIASDNPDASKACLEKSNLRCSDFQGYKLGEG